MQLLKTVILTMVFILMQANLSIAVPQEGHAAIDFKLPDINNSAKIYSLKDLRGKVVLLNIWASWCTGCKVEMPEFVNLMEEFKGKNFQIVAISVDNDKNRAVNFLKGLEEKSRGKINFTVLYDGDKSVTKEYKPLGMPMSYLIDRNGNLTKVFFGSFNKENIYALKAAVKEALK